MKQPENKRTKDLFVPERRPVGRPRQEKVLTDAERAKLYRDRKKERALTARG